MGWFMLVVWFVCVLYVVTRPIDEKDKSSWDWRGQYGNNPNHSRNLDCSSGLEGDSPWESKNEKMLKWQDNVVAFQSAQVYLNGTQREINSLLAKEVSSLNLIVKD